MDSSDPDEPSSRDALPGGSRELGDLARELRRSVAAVLTGGVASVAILASGLLFHGWNPGPIEEYALTEALNGLLGPGSFACGAVVLLLLVPLGYTAYPPSVVAATVLPAAVIFYEVKVYPTSHNLIPFELLALVIGSLALHVPSLVLKVALDLRRRAAARRRALEQSRTRC